MEVPWKKKGAGSDGAGDASPPASPTSPPSDDAAPFDPESFDVTQVEIAEKSQRLTLVAKLIDICKAYGPVKTRNHVLPLLASLARYDDAAFSIASALPDFVTCCGGMLRCLAALKPALDVLMSHPETRVLKEVAESIRLILWSDSGGSTDEEAVVSVDGLPPSPAPLQGGRKPQSHARQYSVDLDAQLQLQDAIISDLERLILSYAVSRRAAQRQSASALLPTLATRPGASKEHAAMILFPPYLKLCFDPCVLVHRTAAEGLHRWQSIRHTDELCRAVRDMIDQNQAYDSVRVAIVDSLVALAHHSTRADRENHLLPMFFSLCQDESWRVRYTASKHFAELMALSPTEASSLVASAVLQAQDEEVEVRVSIASQVGDLADSLPASVVAGSIVAMTVQLATDKSDTVRNAVAQGMAKVCRCSSGVQAKELLDRILSLIETSSPVQSSVIGALSNLGQQLDAPGVVQGFAAALSKAAESANWRVRNSVAEQLRRLVAHLPIADWHHVSAACDSLLVDKVAAVRLALVGSLPHVARQYGPQWTRATALALVTRFSASPHYTERQTLIRCLDALLPHAAESLTGAAALLGSPMPSRPDRASASSPVAPVAPAISPTAAAAAGRAAVDAPFWSQIRECLLLLSRDRVTNVRVSLGKTVSPGGGAVRCVGLAAVCKSIVQSFMEDKDAAVRESVGPPAGSTGGVLRESPF